MSCAPDEAPAGFERVCTASGVATGKLRAVTLSDGTRACIGNHGGNFFAVSDRCPHQKYALSDGELTADGTIICSWHGAAYESASGRSLRGPVRDAGVHEAPLGRLAVYDVRVAGDDVFVRPPELNF